MHAYDHPNNADVIQPPPLLGVTDFAGNFRVTATLQAWGLANPETGGLLNQGGTFAVAVAINSGLTPEPQFASATAQWNGSDLTDFKQGPPA